MPVAWLVVSHERSHVSVYLDHGRAMQAAAELHGECEALVLEKHVAELLRALGVPARRTASTNVAAPACGEQKSA